MNRKEKIVRKKDWTKQHVKRAKMSTALHINRAWARKGTRNLSIEMSCQQESERSWKEKIKETIQ